MTDPNSGGRHLTLLVNLISTVFMTGVIWFVQIVHYPLLSDANRLEFSQFEQRNVELTTWVVMPAMLLEASTALVLLWYRPTSQSIGPVLAGGILLAVIAASTAWIQVPCHDVLCQRFDEVIHQRLVDSNWIRTICWSVRTVLVGSLVAKALK